MKYLLIIFLLFLSNCSLNKDSQYWTEHPVENKKNQKKINEILKKVSFFAILINLFPL